MEEEFPRIFFRRAPNYCQLTSRSARGPPWGFH
jgi:hypothetical protein